MREIIELTTKLVPDMVEVLRKRYMLLQLISHLQPIGRRALAEEMNTTERILRAEVDVLREAGVIYATTMGMSCTEEGMRLLEQLEPLAPELFGLTELAERLKRKLNIPEVIVVNGDSDQSEWVKQELGRIGARVLRQQVKENDVIAVTGGSTIATVASHLQTAPVFRSAQFVPARGGLGENAEMQANTLVSMMAAKSGGQYRLLHAPEQLSPQMLQSLMADPQVAEVLHLLRSARVIVHGIGDALTMAKRRKYAEQDLADLEQAGAVGEAFGYYFKETGEIVRRISTLGLQLEDVKTAEMVISVAGGASKAKAILSFAQQACQNVLITDEGAARMILSHVS
ncbi:MAG: sugar-binding transcriptional regulator [Clostridia bacterium]